MQTWGNGCRAHFAFGLELGLLQFSFPRCACGMSSGSFWGLLISPLPQPCGKQLTVLSEARRCCSLEQLLSLNLAWQGFFYHWQSISSTCIRGFKSQKAAGCQVLCFKFCFMCKLYSHLFSLLIDRRPLGSSSFILDSSSILKGFSNSRFRPPHAYSSSRDWPVSRNRTTRAWDTAVTVRRIWMEVPVLGLLLVQVGDFVQRTAYQHYSQLCRWESHHHSLVCREFCVLIGRAFWCTDRLCLFISFCFLGVPKVQDTSLLLFQFLGCTSISSRCLNKRVGQDTSYYPQVNEYLSHALRAKPEPCYGKINKCVILQFLPVSLWESFSKDLRVNQLSMWKHGHLPEILHCHA